MRACWTIVVAAGTLLTACGQVGVVPGGGSANASSAPSTSSSTPTPSTTSPPTTSNPAPPTAPPTGSTPATCNDVCIQVDAGTSGPAVNRQVLGSNVQWVDGGDNLLAYQTINFDPAMQQLVNTMNPTVLRYPGGAQSDLYDWTRGLGPLSARGTNLQAVSNTPQITYMGSGELLALGATLGAAALFTVNVVNGTAAEAAAWVQQTNVTRLRDATGAVLPKVNYWEIGNEPYLPNPDGSNPNTCLVDATTYVSRVNAFAHAMRAVDPGIKIGIALANDVQNGIQVVSPGCRGFAATVLKGLTEPVDFISVHDAYLPYDPTGKDHPASDEFHAAMASTLSVQTDLANMRALLQPFPQVAGLPFALTEYNAVFSFNSSSAYYYSMASPMGALYVADTMRLLAARDDILMANSWSLSGNDHWGAIHSPTNSGGPYGRPDYEVFRLFGETLQGVRMTASVLSPTFSAPDLGFSSAASGVPLVAVFVTKATSATGSQTLRVFMINKDYTTAHTAAFSIANGGSVSAVQFSQLTAANVLESDDLPNSLVRTDAALPAATASVTLPAHSIALLTVQLAPKSP